MRVRRISFLIAGAFWSALLGFHYLRHFGYLQVPSEDYIGNILPFAKAIAAGMPSAAANKLLPVYPAVLALLSRFSEAGDPFLAAATVFNYALLVPYALLAVRLYRRFLSARLAWVAVVFLMLNPYTLYTALNAELELFLATMTLLALNLLTARGGLAEAAAALTAATKWDSVFIVPAVAWRRFRSGGRYAIPAAVVSAVSGSIIFAAWNAFVLFSGPAKSNTYVGEIARRGPNVYRFLIDCFLVPSGFVQWSGLDAYRYGVEAAGIFFGVITAAAGVLLLVLVITGIPRLIRSADSLKAPMLIHVAGFVIIHMIYQNTKDKYVLPIVWFLVLVIFAGVDSWLIPRLRSLMEHASGRRYLAGAAAFYGMLGIVLLILRGTAPITLFAVIAAIAATISVVSGSFTRSSGILRPVLVFSAILFWTASFSVYTPVILDHYSLRRIEFKEAGLWFKAHAAPDSRLLLSESSVVRYYSGLSSERLYPTELLRAQTTEEFISEIRTLGITHVYIDDFYIRRLRTNDKNALDRKAPLLKELRTRMADYPELQLVHTIRVEPDIAGYLYTVRKR
jgi:hypothetical protein